jgi:undecaprenyl-phosphate 4-deoxy-4-formamido-L-arabinose transferase
VRHAINLITGYSVLPLRIASLAGFGFAVFGFFVLVYVIGRYINEGGVVPGFPFLASIIAIFSGAQLFSIGIIGEYLARIYFNSMGSPYSVIKDSVGHFTDMLEESD